MRSQRFHIPQNQPQDIFQAIANGTTMLYYSYYLVICLITV